jgi:hypothetical protein
MYRNIHSYIIYTLTLIGVRWSLVVSYIRKGTFVLKYYANYGNTIPKILRRSTFIFDL